MPGESGAASRNRTGGLRITSPSVSVIHRAPSAAIRPEAQVRPYALMLVRVYPSGQIRHRLLRPVSHWSPFQESA